MKLTDAVDLSRDEWNNLIDQYIFVDEHRKILKRRLLDGLTYNQLAEEFNFSVPHIKSIIYKSQDKLFRHIKLSSYLFTILLPSEKHPFAYSAGGCFSFTIKSENTGRNVYQNLAAKTPAFRHGDTAALKEY